MVWMQRTSKASSIATLSPPTSLSPTETKRRFSILDLPNCRIVVSRLRRPWHRARTVTHILKNSATELHDAVIHQTPEPAPSFNPEVSSCLEAIIEKLLRKDRESRYQSATELRSDLEALRNEVAPPSV